MGTGATIDVKGNSRVKNTKYPLGNVKALELKKYLGTLPGVEMFRDFYFCERGTIRIVNDVALLPNNLRLTKDNAVNEKWMAELGGLLKI